MQITLSQILERFLGPGGKRYQNFKSAEEQKAETQALIAKFRQGITSGTLDKGGNPVPSPQANIDVPTPRARVIPQSYHEARPEYRPEGLDTFHQANVFNRLENDADLASYFSKWAHGLAQVENNSQSDVYKQKDMRQRLSIAPVSNRYNSFYGTQK